MARNARYVDPRLALAHAARLEARAEKGRRVTKRAWCTLAARLTRATIALPTSRAALSRDLLHHQRIAERKGDCD